MITWPKSVPYHVSVVECCKFALAHRLNAFMHCFLLHRGSSHWSSSRCVEGGMLSLAGRCRSVVSGG
jgi:hypothetical protein